MLIVIRGWKGEVLTQKWYGNVLLIDIPIETPSIKDPYTNTTDNKSPILILIV